MAMPPRDASDSGMDLKRTEQQKMSGRSHVLLFLDTGSMLILPRASLEKGEDLKWTARQKYHESIPIFRNSSRRAMPNGNSAARLF